MPIEPPPITPSSLPVKWPPVVSEAVTNTRDYVVTLPGQSLLRAGKAIVPDHSGNAYWTKASDYVTITSI